MWQYISCSIPKTQNLKLLEFKFFFKTYFQNPQLKLILRLDPRLPAQSISISHRPGLIRSNPPHLSPFSPRLYTQCLDNYCCHSWHSLIFSYYCFLLSFTCFHFFLPSSFFLIHS